MEVRLLSSSLVQRTTSLINYWSESIESICTFYKENNMNTFSTNGTKEECDLKLDDYRNQYKVTGVLLYKTGRDIFWKEVWHLEITYSEKEISNDSN